MILLRPEYIDRAYVETHGLYGFVKRAWPELSATPFIDNWHIPLVCRHLEAVSRGECRDLILNVPPGTSKTSICSILWPIWDWLAIPHPYTGALGWRKFLFGTWESTLMSDANNTARSIITSEWFRRRWGDLSDYRFPIVPLRQAGVGAKSSERATRWEIFGGGCRSITTPGGSITGRHFHIHVLDDPSKPMDAKGRITNLSANLEKVWRWKQSTLSSRWEIQTPELNQTVVVAQRLHKFDLPGRLLAEESGWTHLCLPMRYIPEKHCATPWGEDPRTRAGEKLLPYISDEDLAKRYQMYGVYADAQMQQDPKDEGRVIIDRAWLDNRYRALPQTAGLWLQSWDCAFKDLETSSYVCGQLWFLTPTDGFFLVDQVKQHLTQPGTVQVIRDLSRTYPWSKATTILIEDKANGPAVMQVLGSEVPGMVATNPGTDKAARLIACSSFFEAGNVRLPESAPWLEGTQPDGSDGYITELANFPMTVHDDQVDATTQALLWYHAETGSSWLAEYRRGQKGLK